MKASTILYALAALLGGFVLCAVVYLFMDGRRAEMRQAAALEKIQDRIDRQTENFTKLHSSIGRQVADRFTELHSDIGELAGHSTELRSDIGNLAGHFTELRSDVAKVADLMRVESPADGGHRRLDVRLFAIRSQIAQADHPIIVIGDSLTEGALLPSSICGHAVVNAGVGGLSAAGYLSFAKQFLASEAELIVVALGTNDSTIVSSEWPVVERGYSDLLDLLAQHTHNIVLAGIPPFDMTGALAKGYFNQSLGDRNDAAIRQIAETRKLSFIDLRHDIRGDNLTNDGIHFNAAGYIQWREAVLSHVRSSIGCSQAQAH